MTTATAQKIYCHMLLGRGGLSADTEGNVNTEERGFNPFANCTGGFSKPICTSNGFDGKPRPAQYQTYLLPIP